MKKLNIKKIITMGLITTSILARASIGASAEWREDSTGIYFKSDNINRATSNWIMNGVNEGIQEWYRVDSNGYIIKSCWYQEGSTWYYLMSDGIMATGNNVNTDGYLSNFNNSGAWLGYVYTNGNKTIATVANTATEMTIEPLHKKAVDAAIKDVAITSTTPYTYPEAVAIYDAYMHSFNVPANISECNWVGTEDKELSDTNGKYRIFPLYIASTKEYKGILKVYQSGKCVALQPGEYTGTSASDEVAKYLTGNI